MPDKFYLRGTMDIEVTVTLKNVPWEDYSQADTSEAALQRAKEDAEKVLGGKDSAGTYMPDIFEAERGADDALYDDLKILRFEATEVVEYHNSEDAGDAGDGGNGD